MVSFFDVININTCVYIWWAEREKNTKVVGQAPRENKKLGAASTRKDITWGVVHGPMQILRVMKKFHGIFRVL